MAHNRDVSIRNPHTHAHDDRCNHDADEELTLENISRAADSKEYQTLRLILSMPKFIQESEFYWFMESFPPHRRSGMEVAFMKEKGNALFASGQYQSAIDTYEAALRIVVKKEYEFLSPEFINFGYTDALQNHRQWTLMLDLVACCNNMAQSYLKLGDRVKAIDWLNEVETIFFCNRLLISLEESGEMTSGIVEFYTLRMKAALRLAQIFLDLGNIASSSFFTYVCTFVYPFHFPKGVPEIEKLDKESRVGERLKSRSPDPKILNEWDVSDPRLQVRGIWSKLEISSISNPRKRECPTCWIWRSRLYVFGGLVKAKDGTTDKLVDLWCMDLKKTQRQWQCLPDLPHKLLVTTEGARKAVIYGDHVWLVNNQLRVTRFNLFRNSWDAVQTSNNKSDWPYLDDKILYDPSVELYKDTLYIFGGDQTGDNEGMDALMSLNLRTLEWRRISAPEGERNITNWPHSRRAAASWIIPSEERLYILYGSTNFDQNHVHSKHLEDFWSYSIPGNSWRRERTRGNYPSSRDLMTAAYHEDLDIVICYGGYCEQVPTYSAEDSVWDNLEQRTYTYYGDTFILERSTRSWRQVVTRNFPAWRTATSLLVDSDTNDIYVYGGSCNNYFLDIRKEKPGKDGSLPSAPMAYSDLWHLKLDSCGGAQSSIDMKAFSSLSPMKIGAWRRCYTCKRVGNRFMKCQGSCNGKFIFCSSACQRAAWPTHKNVHGCRRL